MENSKLLIERLNERLKKTDTDYQAHYDRACLKIELNDSQSAINDYEDAIYWRGICKASLEVYDDYLRNIRRRDDVIQKLYEFADNEIKEKHIDSAVKTYLKIIKLDKNETLAYTKLASLYFKEEEYRRAYNICKKCIDLGLKNLDLFLAYFILSDIKEKAQKYKEAALYLKTAYDIGYEIVDFYNDEIKKNSFDTSGLVKCFESKIKKKKSYHGFYDWIDMDGAVHFLCDCLIEIDPCNIEALSALSMCFLREENDNKAIECLNKIIEMYPETEYSYNAYYRIGLTQERNEDYEGAIQNYTNAIELNVNESFLRYGYNQDIVSENLEIYKRRAYAKSKFAGVDISHVDVYEIIATYPDDCAKFIEIYTKFIDKHRWIKKMRDEVESVSYDRGCLYYHIGKYEEAIYDFSLTIRDVFVTGNCREEESNCPGPYEMRAKCYEKIADYSAALRDYYKLIKMYPKRDEKKIKEINLKIEELERIEKNSDYQRMLKLKLELPYLREQSAKCDDIYLQKYHTANILTLLFKSFEIDKARKDMETAFVKYKNCLEEYIRLLNRLKIYDEHDKLLSEYNIVKYR